MYTNIFFSFVLLMKKHTHKKKTFFLLKTINENCVILSNQTFKMKMTYELLQKIEILLRKFDLGIS